MLSTFVELLRASVTEEYGERPCPVTLATPNGLSAAPLPVDARMVICRRVEDDGTTFYCSDGRSNKNWQLVPTGYASLVFWMPSRREQFRIRGLMAVIRANNKTAHAELRPQLWRSLSDATRATFFWPAPGTPLVTDPAAFPTAVGVDESVPATFEVLALDRPIQVEYLNLNPHPHDRRRWREENGWQEERLNP